MHPDMDKARKRVKRACDRCRVKKIRVSTITPNAIKPDADFRVVQWGASM
jgi:hypothetical protein